MQAKRDEKDVLLKRKEVVICCASLKKAWSIPRAFLQFSAFRLSAVRFITLLTSSPIKSYAQS